MEFCILISQVGASLSLMRRLPPHKVEQNLNGLLNLLPAEMDELLQRVDQPLKEETDPEAVSLDTTSLSNKAYFYNPGKKILVVRLQSRW